jgi:sugar phosphate isomerase/epimerase
MFSTRLPPFVSPRSAPEDHAVLVESFGELADHAASVGVVIALEPLNRYENHMINTLGQAAELCAEVASPWFGVAADTYHMNIEEADPVATVRDAGPRLAHVHISDSNRYEPGAGHVDFRGILGALRERGFEGTLAFEGRLSGPAPEVLPRMAAYIRSCWDG